MSEKVKLHLSKSNVIKIAIIIPIVISDKRYSPLIKQIFEMYVVGDKTMSLISDFLRKNEEITLGGEITRMIK